MLLSRGDLSAFIQRSISAWFVGACALLIVAQVVAYIRKLKLVPPPHATAELISE